MPSPATLEPTHAIPTSNGDATTNVFFSAFSDTNASTHRHTSANDKHATVADCATHCCRSTNCSANCESDTRTNRVIANGGASTDSPTNCSSAKELADTPPPRIRPLWCR
jgi:hypothetical protein